MEFVCAAMTATTLNPCSIKTGIVGIEMCPVLDLRGKNESKHEHTKGAVITLTESNLTREAKERTHARETERESEREQGEETREHKMFVCALNINRCLIIRLLRFILSLSFHVSLILKAGSAVFSRRSLI